MFTLAKVCRPTIQKPSGTIKKLQHPPAADPSGWVWPRCQLCGQWRNSAPLSLRDYIMPRRTGTGLRRPGLGTWTVWHFLQQTVCGLSVQWYDTDNEIALVFLNQWILECNNLVPFYSQVLYKRVGVPWTCLFCLPPSFIRQALSTAPKPQPQWLISAKVHRPRHPVNHPAQRP